MFWKRSIRLRTTSILYRERADLSIPSPRAHRGDDPRRVLLVVVDDVGRNHSRFGKVDRQRLTGVRVRFVERCAGARDRYPDAVALVEDDARPADVEVHRVDLARLHE